MTNNLLPTAPFTKVDPVGWFRQLEAVFTLGNVADDETKYVHLQARIDPSVLREVSDFFTNPPAEGKYAALKSKIIGKYSESREGQILQLLEGLTLGDRKPSDLLGELIRLAGADISEPVLRPMFLKKLPQSLAEILAGSTEPLENLGKLADRIKAYQSSAPPAIAAFSATPLPTANSSDELQRIKSVLTAITEAITTLSNRLTNLEASGTQQRHSRFRERSRSPDNRSISRNRSTSQNRNNAAPPSTVPSGISLCYYHYNYGDKARKCKQLDNGDDCLMGAKN